MLVIMQIDMIFCGFFSYKPEKKAKVCWSVGMEYIVFSLIIELGISKGVVVQIFENSLF